MKNKDYDHFAFAEKFMKDALELSRQKNKDYTGNGSHFANFEAVQTFGIGPEQGFIVRMTDKLRRIASYVEKGKLHVKDESVTDTLQDLMNYSVLFASYIEYSKSEEDTNKGSLDENFIESLGMRPETD